MLVRRTLVAALVIVILSMPSVVFASVISRQVPAALWAVMGGIAAVLNLAYGGPANCLS